MLNLGGEYNVFLLFYILLYMEKSEQQDFLGLWNICRISKSKKILLTFFYMNMDKWENNIHMQEYRYIPPPEIKGLQCFILTSIPAKLASEYVQTWN